MRDRLQFVHHDEVFANRESAIQYVKDLQMNSRPSLFAEPIVLKYESGDAAKGPNVILAIGSHGIGEYTEEYKRTDNRTFFIDITESEEAIADLYEKIEELVKTLTLIPLESDTLKAFSEKTDDGTIISGDVKVADHKIINGIQRDNTIQITENGIFHYVSLSYDDNTGNLKFTVNENENTFSIPTVKSGEYVYTGADAETIILTLSDDSEVKIPVGKLINEWTVVPEDANATPIVLKREAVDSEHAPHGVEEWQDVLTADIRLHEGDGNIIYKTDNGRTVFATVSLDYADIENKLIFKWSQGGEIKQKEIALNSVQLIEYIRYDSTTEEIIIGYKTSPVSQVIEVRIPVGELITEWKPVEAGHNVILKRDRSTSGTDNVYADVRIDNVLNSNIIETIGDNKALYVRGEADNIKFGNTNVDAELVRLKGEDERIEGKLDSEINRATAAETVINNTIGTGFTEDPHDNVTYHVQQLTDKADQLEDAIENEEERAILAEETLRANIDAEQSRAEAAEAALQADIDAEEGRAISEELALNDKITAEKTRAEGVESGLNSAIAEEIQARKADVDAEESRATSAETRLKDTIGTGFTDNSYENVTYRFNELSGKVNTVSGKADTNAANIATNRTDINTLSGQVATISGDSANSVKSVTAIANSGITVDNTDHNNPKVGVQLSPDQSNIMVYTATGLKAEVALSYNSAQNQLTLTTSNGGQTNIQLVGISVFDSFRYDPATESIIITYHSEGKQRTMTIPVGDLIREWEPDNNNHTVDIKRVTALTGTDKVSADVKLVSSTDQMIQNTSGALIVSRAPITALESGLATEITNRENADTTLDGKISAEETRAKGVESGLTAAINNEVSARTTADAVLDGKITAEKNRAESAETTLNNAITAETNRASGAEHTLDDKIVAEKNRAESAEGNLQHNIDAEESRAKNVESGLTTAINNEASARTTADSALGQRITDEATARAAQDTALNNAITAETATRTAQDTALNNAITAETANRQSADETLDGKIDAEAQNRQTADSTLNTAITNEVANRISAVNNEASLRTATDNALSGAISTEVAARASGDTVNSNAITAETAQRSAADTALGDRITAEFNRASSAETKNASDIATERQRALNAEAGLTDSIANIKAALSGETSARQTEDAAINRRIDELSGATGGYVTAVTALDGVKVVDGSTANPKVGANLNTSTDNIIRLNNGLYATVDLNYNGTSNQLTFSNGINTKTLQLSSVSVIDSIVYDSVNKEIVITYHSGATEKTVRVSVQDLVKEWEVSNAGHSVTLTRTSASGQTDKLSADVNISTNSHNMLTNENGYLFVSDESINTVSGAVTAETAARIAQDATLNNAITAETAARTAQDTALNTKIDGEKTRAEGVEATLTSSISTVASDLSTETAQRTAADSAMNTRIGAVETNCQNLGTALTGEIARAKSAESGLTNTVNSLTTTTAGLTSSVNTLRSDVDTISGKVNTVSGSVTTLSNNVTALTSTVNTVNTNLGTVSGKVTTLESEVGNIKANTGTISTNLGTVSGKADTNSANIAAISGNVNTISGDVADLKNKAGWITKETSTIRMTKNTSPNPNEVSADVKISTVSGGNMLTYDANGLIVSKVPITNIISAIGRMNVETAEFSGFSRGRFIAGKSISEAIQALNDALEEIYQLYEANNP